MPTIQKKLVREQLKRILNGRPFIRSPQLQAFLRFIVCETLAGQANKLGAYKIATLALGRDDSFDPETDASVRVLGCRLRRRLDRYYAGEGKNDPIRISMPRGGYGAQWDSIAEPFPAESAGRRALQYLRGYPLKIAGATLAAIVSVPAALLGWSQLGAPLPGGLEKHANLARPIIEVRRFRPGTGWDDTHSFATSGLGEEIATGLALKLFKFSRLRIVSEWRDAGNGPGNRDDVNRSGKPPHRFVLDGIVRPAGRFCAP